VVALALKPEYRPSLAELIAPRWLRASRRARVLVVCGLVLLVGAATALVLTLLPPRFSYGGAVPFSFTYRGLNRTVPEGDQLVRVVHRSPAGVLEDSFAVAPLRLPAYSGDLSGELPLFATSYIRALAARDHGFQLRGEGKAKVAVGVIAYNVFYTAQIEGRTMYGRDFLLLRESPGARQGVDIAMLTAPHTNAQVTSPLLVATAGRLYGPLRSLTFD
jgi:hypothetical protein